jgi:DNA-binding transcriptional LysR family regulator
MDGLEWSWLKSFVAVAEAASMREAAERTGSSQPTLSRHVASLEAHLGVTLFDRRGRALVLSPRGTELYESAGRVNGAVDDFLRQATGYAEDLTGGVRITASHVVGQWILPEWIEGFHQRHPGLSVELVLEETAVDLRARDAEIAIRMFRPSQVDLLTRRLGTGRSIFCASERYVARKGPLTSVAAITEHDLIGFDRIPVYLETAASMGVALTDDDFVLRTDSIPAQVAAARAGVGVAVVNDALVARIPELVPQLPGVVLATQEVWLVAHPDLRRSRRVRTAWDDLGAFLSGVYGG